MKFIPFTQMMAAVVLAFAPFAGWANWTVDTSTKIATMTDENGIVLSCDIAGGNLSVYFSSSTSTLNGQTLVDLSKPVEGGYVITAIKEQAFDKNGTIQGIVLPDTLVSVGRAAFRQCSALTSISPCLPASVSFVGDQAFYNAPKLAVEVTLSNPDLTSVLGSTFRGTPITKVDLRGSGVVNIGEYAFENCKSLERVLQSKPFASIGQYAFSVCEKMDGTIDLSSPDCTELANNIFATCKSLEGVKLSPALRSIGKSAFNGCTVLSSVEPFLPPSVTNVSDTAFNKCAIANKRLEFGSRVPVVIGASAFNTSTGGAIGLPESVVFTAAPKSIGGSAFGGVYPKSIEFRDLPPREVGSWAFASKGALSEVFILPKHLLAEWQVYLDPDTYGRVRLTLAEKNTYRANFAGYPRATEKSKFPSLSSLQYVAYRSAGFQLLVR